MKKNIILLLSFLFISSCGKNIESSNIESSNKNDTSNIDSSISSSYIDSSSNDKNDFILVLYNNLKNGEFVINNNDVVDIYDLETIEFYYFDSYSMTYDESKFNFKVEDGHAYLTPKILFNNIKVIVSNGTNQIEFYVNSNVIEKKNLIKEAYINLYKKYSDNDLTSYTYVNLLMSGNYEFFNDFLDITTFKPGTTIKFSCEYFINGPTMDILYINTYPSINYGKINEIISIKEPTYVPYICHKTPETDYYFSLQDNSKYENYPTEYSYDLDCEIVKSIDALESVNLKDGDVVYFAFACGNFYDINEEEHIPCAIYLENPNK